MPGKNVAHSSHEQGSVARSSRDRNRASSARVQQPNQRPLQLGGAIVPKVEPKDSPLEVSRAGESSRATAKKRGAGVAVQPRANNGGDSSSSDECEFVGEERPGYRCLYNNHVSSDEDTNAPVVTNEKANKQSQTFVRSWSPQIGWRYLPLPNRRYVPDEDYLKGRMPWYTFGPRPIVLQDYKQGEVINIYASNSSSGSDSDDSWGRGRRIHKKQTLKRFLEKTARATKRKIARRASAKQVTNGHNDDDSD